MLHEPIVTCAFGWGRIFRLYDDYLDAQGTRYALSDLTGVRPIYRNVLGIPSARLELAFGGERLILRGIAAIDDARKLVEHLRRKCPEAHIPAPSPGWSRTRAEERIDQGLPLSTPAPCGPGEPDLRETTTSSRQAQSSNVPAGVPDWQRARQDLLRRRRDYLRAERLRQTQQGYVHGRRTVRHLKANALPTVSVPVRLASGECAYYSIEATLCGESAVDTSQPPIYPARDHGLLILTSRRLIYIGRKSQILLGYDHLLHISRLHGAVAFLADYWRKREIFALRRPLDCVLCLERILRLFQQQERGRPARDIYLDAHAEEGIRDEGLRALSRKRTRVLSDQGDLGAAREQDAEAFWRTEKRASMRSREAGEKDRVEK